MANPTRTTHFTRVAALPPIQIPPVQIHHDMTNSQAAIIDLDAVTLTLAGPAGPVNVLRGVSMMVARGESVGLMGPSGAGKTSLMMIVAGLERATSGRVAVAGRDLAPLDEDARARFRRDHVGIVFQAFHLVPAMTAAENVAIPLELAGRRDAQRAARDALAEVGLAARADHYPSHYRAASSSASPWRARWRRGRTCCWPTSRPAISIPRPAARHRSDVPSRRGARHHARAHHPRSRSRPEMWPHRANGRWKAGVTGASPLAEFPSPLEGEGGRSRRLRALVSLPLKAGHRIWDSPYVRPLRSMPAKAVSSGKMDPGFRRGGAFLIQPRLICDTAALKGGGLNAPANLGLAGIARRVARLLDFPRLSCARRRGHRRCRLGCRVGGGGTRRQCARAARRRRRTASCPSHGDRA